MQNKTIRAEILSLKTKTKKSTKPKLSPPPPTNTNKHTHLNTQTPQNTQPHPKQAQLKKATVPRLKAAVPALSKDDLEVMQEVCTHSVV